MVAAGRGTGRRRAEPGGAISRRDGGAAGLVEHAGGQPLGVHTVDDRAADGQWRVAPLRPDRAGAGRDRVAALARTSFVPSRPVLPPRPSRTEKTMSDSIP